MNQTKIGISCTVPAATPPSPKFSRRSQAKSGYGRQKCIRLYCRIRPGSVIPAKTWFSEYVRYMRIIHVVSVRRHTQEFTPAWTPDQVGCDKPPIPPRPDGHPAFAKVFPTKPSEVGLRRTCPPLKGGESEVNLQSERCSEK